MSEHPQPDHLPAASTDDGGSVVKPFLDHLEDLRWMLVKMFAAVGVAMVGCFWFARELMSVMIWPLERVTGGNAKPFLRTLEVTGGFMLAMKLALSTGIIIAGPLLMYFLGQFLVPALTRQEKRLLWPAFAAGGGLFIGGVALAYFAALPAGLRFFISYNDYLGITSEWTINNYISFVGLMLLAFGVSFELPLVVLLLAKLGLVSHRFLKDKRPYAIIGIFVFAAVITPTTDPINQTMLAAPLCVLYEACVWVAWAMERRAKS